MATIGLAIVGSAIGPSIFGGGFLGFTGAQLGGIIGGLAGSIIDQTLLLPAAQRGQDIQGPRVDDLQLQTASEGSPIRRCFGAQVRVAGNLIWLFEDSNGKRFREVSSTQKSGGKGGGPEVSQTTFTYFTDVAIGVCEGEIEGIQRVWANGKLIFEQGGEPDARYTSLTVYRGTDSQNADPTIQANEGIDDTPTYRGHAYVVIKNLELSDFGNRLPNFEFEVREKASKPLREAIGDILEFGGLDSSRYDVTRVNQCIRGYAVAGPQSTVRTLEPLLLFYDLLVQEINGTLFFFHLGDEPSQALDPKDILDVEMSPFEMSSVSGLDLPREVNVNYLDPKRRLQRGSQRERRNSGPSEVVETVDLPLVVAAQEARNFAARRLWRSWSERVQVTIKLSSRFLHLLESDSVAFTHENESFTMRVLGIEKGNDMSISLQGLLTESQALNQNILAEEGDFSFGETYIPPEVELLIMDLPPIRDGDAVSAGYYFAASAKDFNALWRGGVLFESFNGSTFDRVRGFPAEAVIVQANTALPDGPVGVWDRGSTVEVTVLHGELASDSKDNVLNGSNVLLLGQEIIAFQTATLIDTNKYRLSNLIRGLRNTEEHTDAHTSSDRGVLLTGGGVAFIAISSSAIGTIREFKAIGSGGDVSVADSETEELNAETLKSFSPANIEGERDGSDNLTISWQRRSRAITTVIPGPGSAPLMPDENPEAYEVDIMSGSTVLRTIEADSETAEYTAAEQTSDGLTPGDPVTVRIYQINSSVGRGRKGEATI